MRFRSKRYKADFGKQPQEAQELPQAIKTVKGYSKTKFDQSVDMVCHLGIDANQADQMLRGSFSFPKGIGKQKKVIAFVQEGDIPACTEAGAAEAGADELVDRVAGGWMDFDVAIAHPSMMGKVGKLGRVLGPTGKMPSPKSGTVTPNVAQAVKEFAAGKVEFRNDKGGNVHVVVGRMSFADDDLKENIEAFIDHLKRLKPAAAKGTYIKRVCLSGTMTPSVTVAVSAQ
ncbi:MAG: 50S ribosomal protein L1 [Phycisphaerales bacterium]|nr:50S ribosomal protein L1 [Phycisphaerales bacterium]